MNYACIINWNNFPIEIPKNSSKECCYIYVDGLNGDSQQDLEKISKIIKSIPGLKQLRISSNDFRVAEYFNVLLKNFNIEKYFDLLNDFEFKDRSEIDFSALSFDESTIPFDYIMYGVDPNGITKYNLQTEKQDNIVKILPQHSQKKYLNIQDKINCIIDEIFGQLPMEQLDEIDKNVLVSNWIQRYIQFIAGKVSEVGSKEFICDDFKANDDTGDIMTIIDKHFGVCDGIAKLSVALLSNPRVNCKCNLSYCYYYDAHAFFTQLIDGVPYITDNTWCITRNPHHVGESLKASSFSDEYILIGQDKISEDEDTLKHHTRTGLFKGTIPENGIPRERINQSIEKLKNLGVTFSYDEPPIFIQHEEVKEK